MVGKESCWIHLSNYVWHKIGKVKVGNSVNTIYCQFEQNHGIVRKACCCHGIFPERIEEKCWMWYLRALCQERLSERHALPQDASRGARKRGKKIYVWCEGLKSSCSGSWSTSSFSWSSVWCCVEAVFDVAKGLRAFLICLEKELRVVFMSREWFTRFLDMSRERITRFFWRVARNGSAHFVRKIFAR